jgi:hypothetical protein
LNVIGEDKPVGEAIEEAGANAVLTTNKGSLDAALKDSPLWKAVYRDPVAVVYEFR